MFFECEAAVSLIMADFLLRQQMDRVGHFVNNYYSFFLDSLKNETKLNCSLHSGCWKNRPGTFRQTVKQKGLYEK